jgi:putative hydrolase of the HAD superfamily
VGQAAGGEMIEAVFFDAGETLLSPVPSWSELSTTILQERGHDVTLEQLRDAWRFGGQHFQNAADEGFMFSASAEDSHHFWTTLYHDMIDHLGLDDDEAPEILYKTFSNPANYALYDDVMSTLDAMRDRGLKLGIISNFESWLRNMLEHLGIIDRFEVIAISGDLQLEKPDPRIFKWAMQEAGVDAPASLHVGDSPNFDPAPAHELGMTGVLLDRHARWTDLNPPYPIVSTLTELLDLV